MRQWRVGTITLGLTLLIVGSGLVYARFQEMTTVDLLLQWWPLAFIALGLEILACHYLNRQGEERMKYDFISIFLLLFIVSSGLGLQFISETGLANRLSQEINSEYYSISIAEQQVAVPAEVDKIIIRCNNTDMDIRTAPVQICSISGYSSVRATSREEAARIVMEQEPIRTRVAGNVMLIESESAAPFHSGLAPSCSIVVPEALEVEINGSGNIKYTASGNGNPLAISGKCAVELFLPASADVSLLAYFTDHQPPPGGNLQWTRRAIDDWALAPAHKEPLYDNGNEYQQDYGASQEKPATVEYQCIIGNGSNAIRLIDLSSLIVYKY